MDLSNIIVFIYLIGCLMLIYLTVKLNKFVAKKIKFNVSNDA